MGIFTGSLVLGAGAGESTGGGSGGGLSSVKTDGKTITGDGNATPLALGAGEPFGVGSYVIANFDGTFFFRDVNNEVIKGEPTETNEKTFINTIVPGLHLSLAPVLGSSVSVDLAGTWISCSPVNEYTDNNRAVWRRIA